MRLRSEDYVLCDRFRAAGGKVWVDVELTLHHAGMQTWKGHFGDYLRSGADGHVTKQKLSAKDYALSSPHAIAPGVSLIGALENMIAGEAA
jgi:hypothetical protein